MKLRINYAIDAAMFVAFLLCGATGLAKLPALDLPMGDATYLALTAVHDWSGVAVAALIAVHALLHVTWMRNATRTIFAPASRATVAAKASKPRRAGVKGVVALLAFLLVPLSGFAMGHSSSMATLPQGIAYPAGTLKDGTYTGSATGYRAGLTVAVTVKGGKIASVDVVSSAETPRWFNRVLASLPALIVKAQSTDVDAVSGATSSSHGLCSAVEAALKSAVAAK